MGKYGELFPPEIRLHPLKQVNDFCRDLKQDLRGIDSRFQHRWITPVVVFFSETDIRDIHDVTKGVLFLHELPDFFRSHRTGQAKPEDWIIKALGKVYTWDTVTTTRQETWKGTLRDQHLFFQGLHGREQLSLQTVRTITLERSPFFSAYDTLLVERTDGQMEVRYSIDGLVQLDLPDDTIGTIAHSLRNVAHLTVGIANKL